MKSPKTQRRTVQVRGLPGRVSPPLNWGTFSARGVILTPGEPGWDGGGLLAADMTVSWSQPITRVYEIGTSACYLTVDPATGNWQAAQIVAPTSVSFRFYQTYAASHPGVPPVSCETADRKANGTRRALEQWVMSGVAVNGVGLQVVQGPLAVQQHVVGLFDNWRPTKGR